MPVLRSSPASPFGRKVKISAALVGLLDRIEPINANTNDPADDLRIQNPLGKIPALILDDGTAVYDSRVIVEWLDMQSGGKLIPDGDARIPALVLQALADGIMDAALLIIYEGRYRPAELHHEPWLDRQRDKIARSLDYLEAAPPAMSGGPHIGHIALACALAYLDFRIGSEWRDGRPKLVAWLETFAEAVPVFAETAPYDA
jgi:glutathione S-transferase